MAGEAFVRHLPHETSTPISSTMMGFSAVASLLGVTVVVIAGIRLHHRPPEWPTLLVLASAATVSAVAAWFVYPEILLGFSIGVAWVTLWTWSAAGQTLAIPLGGMTLGGVLYYAGPDFILGSLAALGLFYSLRLGKLDSLEVRGPRSGVGRVPPYRVHALMCYGEMCQLKGAEVLRETTLGLSSWRSRAGVRMTTTQCMGRCHSGPVVRLEPSGEVYERVTPKALVVMMEGGRRE